MRFYLLSILAVLAGAIGANSDIPPQTASAPIAASTALPNAPKRVLYASYKIEIDGGSAACSVTAIDAHHAIGAGHCARGSHDWALVITDPTGTDTEKRITIHPVKSDWINDLCLWESDDVIPNYNPIEWGRVEVGCPGVTIGAPEAHSPYHIAMGYFAAVDLPASWGHVRAGELAVVCDHGSSGCGVYDGQWHFVGVLVRGSNSFILFVPTDVVKAFLADIPPSHSPEINTAPPVSIKDRLPVDIDDDN